MSAQLRCNAIVTELGNTDHQCPAIFPMLANETPADARVRAHVKGWRVRTRVNIPDPDRFPTTDRCPAHARQRKESS